MAGFLTRDACRPLSYAVALGLAGLAGWCATAQAAFPGQNGRIAFTARVSGVEPLDPDFSWVVTVRADGEDPRVLAGVKARGPAYRADGRMVAFSRFRELRAAAGFGHARAASM